MVLASGSRSSQRNADVVGAEGPSRQTLVCLKLGGQRSGESEGECGAWGREGLEVLQVTGAGVPLWNLNRAEGFSPDPVQSSRSGPELQIRSRAKLSL